MDQRGDQLGAAGLQGPPRLVGRQPPARRAVAAQGPDRPEREPEAGLCANRALLQARATVGKAMRSTLTASTTVNVDLARSTFGRVWRLNVDLAAQSGGWRRGARMAAAL